MFFQCPPVPAKMKPGGRFIIKYGWWCHLGGVVCRLAKRMGLLIQVKVPKSAPLLLSHTKHDGKGNEDKGQIAQKVRAWWYSSCRKVWLARVGDCAQNSYHLHRCPQVPLLVPIKLVTLEERGKVPLCVPIKLVTLENGGNRSQGEGLAVLLLLEGVVGQSQQAADVPQAIARHACRPLKVHLCLRLVPLQGKPQCNQDNLSALERQWGVAGKWLGGGGRRGGSEGLGWGWGSGGGG